MAKKETVNEKTKPEFATDEPEGTEMEPEVEIEFVVPGAAPGAAIELEGAWTAAGPAAAIYNLREHFNTHRDAHIRDTALAYLNYLESHCHSR